MIVKSDLRDIGRREREAIATKNAANTRII